MPRVNGIAIEDYKNFDVRETGLAHPGEPTYKHQVSNGYAPTDFLVGSSQVLYLPLYLLKGSKFKSVDRYQHTATVIGALWRPNGRWFDITDDKITVPDAASIQNLFDGGGTAFFWINPASDGEGNEAKIYNKSHSFYVIGEAAGKVKLRVVQPGGTQGVWTTTSTEVTINTWSSAAMTFNATTMAAPLIYVNGVSVAVTEDTAGVAPRTTDVGTDLTIGNHTNQTRTWDGLIGEVWFISSLLSASEVLHIHRATNWRYQ